MLTKTKLVARLAEETELSKVQVKEFLDTLADVACKEAAQGVALPGIGKLVLVDRKERQGRNPATGEPITIPAKKVVKFRVSKACSEAVLANA
jgi:DNA-binding protein HU-beta